MRLTAILITILFAAFYISLEFFKRKYKIPSEYTRKLAHLFSGVGSLFASYFLNQKEFLGIVFLFFVLFFILYFKKGLAFLQIKTRKTYGEVMFPLGLAVLGYFLYSEKELFMYGMLILAIPDVLAGLIGYHLGKNKKSFWGSLTYFASSLTLLITCFNPAKALVLSSFLTLVEYLSPYGFDNLTVPLCYLLIIHSLF